MPYSDKPRQREAQKLIMRQRRERFRAAGLCAQCGKETAEPGRLGKSCLAKARAYHQQPRIKQRRSELTRAKNRARRLELIEAYGGACECCGESEEAFLAIDHVNGNGREHRLIVGSHVYRDLQRRGWPREGFSLVCHNCHAARHLRGVCPHKVAVR